MKVRLIIDVTNVLSVPFISGIQRVAREIVVRLAKREAAGEVDLLLLNYDSECLDFTHVPTQFFMDYVSQKNVFSGKSDRRGWFRRRGRGGASQAGVNNTGLGRMDPASFTHGDVFFDIDSVWNNRMRRSFLLPRLRAQGVKIAVFIQDIIPILYPQYCDRETAMRFMDFAGAYFRHADLIFANSQQSKEDMLSCIRDLQLASTRTESTESVDSVRVQNSKRIEVVYLGADFARSSSAPGKDRKREKENATSDSLSESPFLFFLGTMEPRKNIDFLLDVYESRLRDLGFRVVIAGRPGWNVDALMQRISHLQKSDPDFLYLPRADDETVATLFRKAFFTVFPTHYEGYGLPIVESFLRGTPVLATDIPVLREVGGDLCDYFLPGDADSLTQRLMYYKENPDLYQKRREALRSYTPFTWEETEREIWEGLRSLYQD